MTSTEELVEVFNDHFSTIGPRLAESIPNDNDVNFRDFNTRQKSSNGFSFGPASVTFVYTLLVKLSTSKATGRDKISGKVLCRLLLLLLHPLLLRLLICLLTWINFPLSGKLQGLFHCLKKVSDLCWTIIGRFQSFLS
jgi:hypothetical protein